VDRWIAISAAVEDEMRAAGIPPDRIVRVPNGVVLPEAARQLPDRAVNFLHLGRLDHAAPRDFEGLIACFSEVARDRPLELAIVGGGDRLHELRSLAAGSPAASRIQIPGFGDGEAWRSWAHVLVQPSYFEGMSNALLEAMACGLACIAYDIAPNREALADGEAGLLVPPGDRAALARAIHRVATEPGLARDLGARARLRAGAYDIDHIAATLERVYVELPGPVLAERAR
jgi:glycosyltransferase involved in cell wall biosynthesis